MDKWFEGQFRETSTNMKRHAEVLKCNIDTFEKTHNEKRLKNRLFNFFKIKMLRFPNKEGDGGIKIAMFI